MPTLRDHVKDALAAQDPSPAQARADLLAVADRARRARRTRWRWQPAAIALVMASSALGTLAWLQLRPHAPQTRADPSVTAVPVVPSGDGVPGSAGVAHLYVRLEGEPEARALIMDMQWQGEP